AQANPEARLGPQRELHPLPGDGATPARPPAATRRPRGGRRLQARAPLPAAAERRRHPGGRPGRLHAARGLPGHLRRADAVAGVHGRDAHLLTMRASILAVLVAVAAARADDLAGRGAADVERASAGCVTCHTATDTPTM